MARWDAGLSATQRAWIVSFGRHGFAPQAATRASLSVVLTDWQKGDRHPEAQASEMGAEMLADPVVCKAIKAYRKHLGSLSEPLTEREGLAVLTGIAQDDTAEPSARIKAVVEVAKLKGWGKKAKAELRLVEAQASGAEAQAAPPASTVEALVIPPMVSPEKWGCLDG